MAGTNSLIWMNARDQLLDIDIGRTPPKQIPGGCQGPPYSRSFPLARHRLDVSKKSPVQLKKISV